MNHLTNEQFEDVMQGLPEPDHLAQCDHCRALLAEKRAISARLRGAFRNVKPDNDLAAAIRKQLQHSEHRKVFPRLWRGDWRKIAGPIAAAAVFMILVGIIGPIIRPPSAFAAQAELAQIHQYNLSYEHELHYTNGDPEAVADYFKRNLGFKPSVPVMGSGMSLRGCCLRQFRGQMAGSYVVDTPQGVISIIIIRDTPRSLGKSDRFEYQGRTFWKGEFENNNMVTMRLEEYSYCAVGEISHNYLVELLSLVMSD